MHFLFILLIILTFFLCALGYFLRRMAIKSKLQKGSPTQSTNNEPGFSNPPYPLENPLPVPSRRLITPSPVGFTVPPKRVRYPEQSRYTQPEQHTNYTEAEVGNPPYPLDNPLPMPSRRHQEPAPMGFILPADMLPQAQQQPLINPDSAPPSYENAMRQPPSAPPS